MKLFEYVINTIIYMKGIAQGIVTAIKDNNFHSIAKDNVEVIIDGFLKDGIIKDIPFMGMLSRLLNLEKNVRDQVFLKKIIRFLIHSETTTPEERFKVMQEIDDSKEHGITVDFPLTKKRQRMSAIISK
jgi:hypothetical protein